MSDQEAEPRNWWGRMVDRVAGAAGYMKVTAIPPGRADDGLISVNATGTSLDRPWTEFQGNLKDTREAWRKNPMVRRMVGQTTAYTVGPGISISSEKPALKSFIDKFWTHPQNNMDVRIPEWSDELVRAGELFIVMFTNPSDGMSYVRVIPADLIVEIDFDENDYERELRYREATKMGEKEKWWISPQHPNAGEVMADGFLRPWVLHYAINRPVGTVRGESDLSSLLPWVKRYEGWLSDRVSLNAAMRSFYFVVYAAGRIRDKLIAKYRTPPPKGSVIIAEEGAEKWEAVTPQLGARDAKEDGKAIRHMIVAGGLGTSLVDLGESDDEGLGRSANADEQRRRFLLRRQRYVTFMLRHLVVTAYNRKIGLAATGVVTGRAFKGARLEDIICKPPDISAEDNGALSIAAKDLMTAVEGLRTTIGDTDEFRALALRLFVKFMGESITETESAALLAGDPQGDAEAAAEGQAKIAKKYAPEPAAHSSNGVSKGGGH